MMRVSTGVRWCIFLLAVLKLAGVPLLVGISWFWLTVPLFLLGAFRLLRLAITFYPAIATMRQFHQMMRSRMVNRRGRPETWPASGVVIEGEIVDRHRIDR